MAKSGGFCRRRGSRVLSPVNAGIRIPQAAIPAYTALLYIISAVVGCNRVRLCFTVYDHSNHSCVCLTCFFSVACIAGMYVGRVGVTCKTGTFMPSPGVSVRYYSARRMMGDRHWPLKTTGSIPAVLHAWKFGKEPVSDTLVICKFLLN